MFMPDLPSPPAYNSSDFAPSINWTNVKHVVVYKEPAGNVHVVACETREEFEAENLTATFNPGYEIIETWNFKGK
jgi:hypothetical protein